MDSSHGRPIYFLHIPKTAGSSVTQWLASRIAQDRVCPAKNWDQLVQRGHIDPLSFDLFAGHYGIDLDAYLGIELRTITVLRDPVQRTLSHYLHVHRDPNHPWHSRVGLQSFDAFLRDRQNWPMVENFQARYLVRSFLDIKAYIGRLDPSIEKSSRLSTTSEDVRYLFDKAYVGEQSREALDRLDSVGTTDRLRAFLEQAARMFSLPPVMNDDVPIENVATNRDAIEAVSQTSLDLIAELTALDQSLFEIVRSREPSAPTSSMVPP